MNLLVAYAIAHVGLPYIWGGNNPVEGYDCSGFALEMLRAGGAWGHDDATSQMIFDRISSEGAWNKNVAGALAFYGKDAKHITHVGFLVNQYQLVEAAGGGSRTTTTEAAAEHNAFIRLRPVSYRSDLRAVILPDYTAVGLVY